VPARRVKSEQRIVQPQPHQEQRTIVARGTVKAAGVGPEMRSEVMWEVTPALDFGVVDDLVVIVVNEIEAPHLRVTEQAESQGQP